MSPISNERPIERHAPFDFDLWEDPVSDDTEALIPDTWEDFAHESSLSLHERRTAPPPARATPLRAVSLAMFELSDEDAGWNKAALPSNTEEPSDDVWLSATVKAPPVTTAASLLDEAHTKLARGNHAAALLLAEQALALEPDNFEADRCIQICQQHLRALYIARVGSLTQVPQLRMTMAELCTLSLDARAFFLLSRIDGQLMIEELIDISGMQELEALRYLHEFQLMEVISMS